MNGKTYNMKRLVVTVGLPRSGKSTWALAQRLPLVNPDAIRLALHGERFLAQAEPMVWVLATYMAKSLLLAGHSNVIIDGTHNTAKRRKVWIDLAKASGWDILFALMMTDKDECLRRAILAQDAIIIPVIDRMAKEADWLPINIPEGMVRTTLDDKPAVLIWTAIAPIIEISDYII